MTDLTLRQAADLLGISKNTLKYRLAKLPDGLTYVVGEGRDKRIYVTEEGFNRLKETVKEKPPKESSETDTETPKTEHEPPKGGFSQSEPNEPQFIAILNRTIETLTGQIESLTAQLTIKDEQIAQLMQLVNQSQQLHAKEQRIAHTKSIESAKGKKKILKG